MSRRDYDRYDDRDRESEYRPRRRDREYEEIDVDITRERYPESRVSRAPRETVVKERDTVISDRRTERGPRQPDFLREDYGRNSNAGQLVVREERREEDTYSRAPTRRRSVESVRSRPPPERVVEKEELVIRERERDRGPPYPRSERGFEEKEEVIIRERARSRPPPPRERSDEEIDIKIKRTEESRPAPPRSEVARSEVARTEYRERDREVDEIRFRRGGGDRPTPPRTEIDREEIRYTESRGPPARSERGRDIDIDIDIREREVRTPRPRSPSRGALVAKEREEWIVRRRRESPPPPPRDYEKEEIIIRRKERSLSPEPPPREPSPEPLPPPPPALEPIVRPPIIQEVITHHRHIDHGIERVRSPSPAPLPPPPPSPPREENLEIEIRRKGMRNGKYYDEDIIFEQDISDRKSRRDEPREQSRRRSISASTRRKSRSPVHRAGRYAEDDMAAEADYYNRKVKERAYPGEAYNGATKDWGLVDVPPGTERVRMEGLGGGRQEIYWERYNGERRGKFITGDRAYEPEWGNGLPEAPIAPPPPPARDEVRETRITERRIVEETSRGKTKDKMWTEITKDLVTKEAIVESGYEFEETEDFFYVIEYLRYEDVLALVSLTEDIRRERRERLREIQWEREEMERLPKMIAPPPPPMIPPVPVGKYTEERVYEREYVYDRDGRRYR